MDPQFEVCQRNLEILEQETDAKGRRLQVIKVRRGRMKCSMLRISHYVLVILRAWWLICTGPSRWQFGLELAMNSGMQAPPDSRHCSCCYTSSALLQLLITPAATTHHPCGLFSSPLCCN